MPRVRRRRKDSKSDSNNRALMEACESLKHHQWCSMDLKSVLTNTPLPEYAADCAIEMELLSNRQRAVSERLKDLLCRSNVRSANCETGDSASSITNELVDKPHRTEKPNELLKAPGDLTPSVIRLKPSPQYDSLAQRAEDNETAVLPRLPEEHRAVGQNQKESEETDIGEIPHGLFDVSKKIGLSLSKTLTEKEEEEELVNQQSTPLILALKKLQQRDDQKSGIKMWTTNLADLFFITDTDNSGYIDEEEYNEMIEKLDISPTTKSLLRTKFHEIDEDDSGGISLYEFLLFFLKYPKFNEELLKHAHSNAPYKHEKNQTRAQKIRLWLYYIVECPGYNLFSRVLFCLDCLLTIVPVLALVLQAIHPSQILRWEQKSYMWFISIFFAVEWLCGLLTCKRKLMYIKTPWHILELISFIFWIVYNTVVYSSQLDTMGFVVFRFLRILKLHTVFNWTRFRENLSLYYDTLQLAYVSYGAVAGFMIYLIIFFSFLFYVFERGQYNEELKIWIRDPDEGESPFSDILKCVYFTVVTMTTLGYGDLSPKSYIGMAAAIFSVVVGLGNITFLINIIGDCFEEVFRVFVQKRTLKMESERLQFIRKQVNRASNHVKVMQSKSQRRMSRIFNRQGRKDADMECTRSLSSQLGQHLRQIEQNLSTQLV